MCVCLPVCLFVCQPGFSFRDSSAAIFLIASTKISIKQEGKELEKKKDEYSADNSKDQRIPILQQVRP